MSAILVCTPACTMSRSNGRSVAALGAVSAIGGVVLMKSGDVDADHDGSDETVLDDDLGQKFFGAMLFAAGIGMVIAGLTAERPEAEADVAWTPTPIVQPPAPVFAPAPASTVTVTVTTTVLVSAATLPEVATTPYVLQMAQQARSAAGHGHCESAWYMVDKMEREDAAYAAAFSAGPVLDGCPSPR